MIERRALRAWRDTKAESSDRCKWRQAAQRPRSYIVVGGLTAARSKHSVYDRYIFLPRPKGQLPRTTS